jgi:hypothetical protein
VIDRRVAQALRIALAACTATRPRCRCWPSTRRGGHALALAVDVRDEAAVKAALDKTAAHFGGLDIVVNNASATTSRSLAVRRRRRCFFYSRDRAGEHPERHLHGYAGILQADAYAGFNRLYEAGRKPGPITEASCWAHGRRKFFELADVTAKANGKLAVIAPLAFAAVQRIDAIFDLEREINGRPVDERLAVRRAQVAPLVSALETWMRAERAKLSRHSEVAKAMNYILNRWETFARFLHDGRICLTNNAAERALRGIALGRKSWLFAGSDRGGERAAVMYTLIQTARLNDVDPQAWLADARPHQRSCYAQARRAAALELEDRPSPARGLIVAAVQSPAIIPRSPPDGYPKTLGATLPLDGWDRITEGIVTRMGGDAELRSMARVQWPLGPKADFA